MVWTSCSHPPGHDTAQEVTAFQEVKQFIYWALQTSAILDIGRTFHPNVTPNITGKTVCSSFILSAAWSHIIIRLGWILSLLVSTWSAVGQLFVELFGPDNSGVTLRGIKWQQHKRGLFLSKSSGGVSIRKCAAVVEI